MYFVKDIEKTEYNLKKKMVYYPNTSKYTNLKAKFTIIMLISIVKYNYSSKLLIII